MKVSNIILIVSVNINAHELTLTCALVLTNINKECLPTLTNTTLWSNNNFYFHNVSRRDAMLFLCTQSHSAKHWSLIGASPQYSLIFRAHFQPSHPHLGASG